MEIAEPSVRRIIGLSLALCVLWVAPAGAQIPTYDPKHYDNEKYQFSVDLPEGFPACMGAITNHGVYILLVPATRCGDENDQTPYIGLFGNYNVGSEVRTRDHRPARTPGQLARIYCPDHARRAIEWLYRVPIGGRRAFGCRQCFNGGRISVWLATLRKTEASADGWIEVSAYLQTTVARYRSDMHLFRRVLKTVWIHPDGPDD